MTDAALIVVHEERTPGGGVLRVTRPDGVFPTSANIAACIVCGARVFVRGADSPKTRRLRAAGVILCFDHRDGDVPAEQRKMLEPCPSCDHPYGAHGGARGCVASVHDDEEDREASCRCRRLHPDIECATCHGDYWGRRFQTWWGRSRYDGCPACERAKARRQTSFKVLRSGRIIARDSYGYSHGFPRWWP